MSPHTLPNVRQQGFTLIELLVALVVMAVLAMLSWRAMDGASRAQALTRERSDEVLRLQAVLGQWRVDLDSLTETGELPALDFDGRVLRMTRRDSTEDGVQSPGLRVVAWSRLLPSPGGADSVMWARWQSGPLQTREDLARAWQRAQVWGREEQGNTGRDDTGGNNTPDSSLRLIALDDWQLFYHRGQGWSNPQSAVGTTSPGVAPPGAGASAPGRSPQGVRLVLNLSAGKGVAGPLSIDWVSPSFSPASP